ncbi:hypothetical protein K502DRAFT_352929 [Neoconidiobolus thromboides FSU 785]|nr:hypothetical protein K502DRAFT_352929 [Neoconidiobolus thromboides FSU 785]
MNFYFYFILLPLLSLYSFTSSQLQDSQTCNKNLLLSSSNQQNCIEQAHSNSRILTTHTHNDNTNNEKLVPSNFNQLFNILNHFSPLNQRFKKNKKKLNQEELITRRNQLIYLIQLPLKAIIYLLQIIFQYYFYNNNILFSDCKAFILYITL